jgi:hypothetical protein
MNICFDKKISAILASDSSIKDDRFLRHDGKIIKGNKYQNYFNKLRYKKDNCKLPDLTETESKLDNQVKLYIRCLL